MKKKGALFFIGIILVLIVFKETSIAQHKIRHINSAEIIAQGIKLHDEEKYDEAIELYNTITRNDTNYLLSLAEKSLSYIKNEEYDKAIKVCNEALAMGNSAYEENLYINLGTTLDNSEKPEESIAVFDKGMEKFPRSHLLCFNKAVTLQKMGKIQEAVEVYKQTIKINPFHASSHLRLGLICSEEDKIVQAMLSLNIFLIIEPTTARAREILIYINKMVSEKQDVELKGIKLSKEGDDFSELELIINNRAALSKKYKVNSEVNFPMIKQNHVLFEKLEYDEDDKGYWMQLYVPFFKKLFDEGWFKSFSYFCIVSSGNEKHKKIVEKNLADLKKFQSWAKGEWGKKRKKKIVELNDKKQELTHWYYSNNALQAIGNKDKTGDFMIGDLEFYHTNGLLSSKGSRNNKGERIGKWAWYYKTGKIKEEVSYENGKSNGEYQSFYENGNLASKSTYKDGKLENTMKEYSETGTLLTTAVYKEGKLNDNMVIYNSIGVKEYDVSYIDDKISGPVIEYYDDGSKSFVAEYMNSKKNGPLYEYYRNGQLKSESVYKDNNAEGVMKEYYQNGNLKEEGIYKNNTAIDVRKTYYSNGKLYEESVFDENGKLNGILKAYTRADKLHYEFEYRKGDIIGYKYYDKKGNILNEDRKKRNEFEFAGFYPDGTQKFEGKYENGMKEGLWKYYDKNGVLDAEEQFIEGQLQGKYKSYFVNGQLKKESNYKDDELDGYQTSYYSNGVIESEGWYKDRKLFGERYTYQPNGTIDDKNYYLDNKLNGWQEHYTVHGKLSYENYYEKDNLIKTIYYDTSENVFETIELKNSSGEHVYHYFNDQKHFIGYYSNGKAHGKFTWYHFNGKVKITGGYHNDNKNGNWTWYYDNGKNETEGVYYYGEKDSVWRYFYKSGKILKEKHYKYGKSIGEWKWFYENGQVELKYVFKDGKRHGTSYYYNIDGQLQYVRYYYYGKLIGYSYNDKNGKLVDQIDILNETEKVVAYYQNGQKSVEFERVNGWLQGPYIKYYPDGQISEHRNYKDYDLDGIVKAYYLNGQLKEEENYLYDELHGTCKYYREDGKLEKELKYILGSLHGECKYYYKNGKLQKTRHYYNGDIFEEL